MRLATGVFFAVLSTFTQAARAETLPDVLRRVAPKVVRVQYDEDSIGTGFVYPDDRHITTAYSVVNRKGEPEVVLRTGAVFKVKVVAWSEDDDLAILELPVSSGQYALELEPSEPYAGEDVGADVKTDFVRDWGSRIDPTFVIQDVESFFIVSASWMPTRRAARLDLGIVLNRF